MDKQIKKKIKWIISYQKERIWLETMAKEGWFLQNITGGIIYTFRKDEPKNMMYEIDRFNLPKKPTLEEIRHKEVFMDVAAELGWMEVTHDESLTYYFCKEYVEGEINELYNDEESRKQRAAKFSHFLNKKCQELVFWGAIIMFLAIIFLIIDSFHEGVPSWFIYFAMCYVAICNGCAVWHWKIAKAIEEELAMSRGEWEEKRNPAVYKRERKLIITMRGLNRFLKKQEEQGWILSGVSPVKYDFIKKEESHQVYTMDSRWLTNQRQKKKEQNAFKDKKDWIGMNNDWQAQSLKDAEELGWTFVCALENRAVIYRGDAGSVTPLNDEKYSSSFRGISLIGDYGLTVIVSGLIGGIIGFFAAYLGIV